MTQTILASSGSKASRMHVLFEGWQRELVMLVALLLMLLAAGCAGVAGDSSMNVPGGSAQAGNVSPGAIFRTNGELMW